MYFKPFFSFFGPLAQALSTLQSIPASEEGSFQPRILFKLCERIVGIGPCGTCSGRTNPSWESDNVEALLYLTTSQVWPFIHFFHSINDTSSRRILHSFGFSYRKSPVSILTLEGFLS